MAKKTIPLLTMLALSFAPGDSLCQMLFEPGYFVGNDGQRVSVLIRNEKWKNTPSQVRFKPEGSEEEGTGTVDTWQEFGLDDGVIYQRGRIALDRSSTQLSDLESGRSPKFREETVFLLRVIAGKASLYVYEESKFERYFLRMNGDSLIPLIYKVYRTPGGEVGRNETYKGQLSATLSCPHLTEGSQEELRYQPNSLMAFVSHYNVCQGGTVEASLPRLGRRRATLHVYFLGGISSQSMKIENTYSYLLDQTIGPEPSTQAGLEGELLFPSRGNRWGIVFGASYQYFDGEMHVLPAYKLSVKYQTVDITVGPRYFLHINQRSRGFLNAGVAYAFAFDSELLFGSLRLELDRLPYYWIGAGYQWSRLGIELRYVSPRDPLNKHSAYMSTLSGAPYFYFSFRMN